MAGRKKRPNSSRIRASRMRLQCNQLYPDEDSIQTAFKYHVDRFYNARRPIYHPDYGAEDEILHLVTLFNQYLQMKRPKRSDWERSDLISRASYTITFLCYYWQIKNSKLVCRGLRYLYQSKKTFRSLFRTALSYPRDFHTFRNSWPRVYFRGMPPVSYFSHHSSKQKASFDGLPFVDFRLRHYNGYKPSPLYYVCMTRNPSAVKSLLRYGACITPPPGKPQWVASLVLKLIGKAVKLGVLQDADRMAEEGAEKLTEEQRAERGWIELECANVLLQAMPPLRLRHIRFRPNDHWKRHFIDSADFVITMSDRKLVPRLKYCFLEPATLKHMCRVVVREKLQRNRELPFGIGKLEVPREVKAYLNLEGEE